MINTENLQPIDTKSHIPTLKISNISPFSVKKTFDCGQSFRFEEVKNTRHECEFAGFAYGKYISIANDNNDIYLYNVSYEEYVSKYAAFLGLDVDYNNINEEIMSLSKNENLHEAIDISNGIRILKQERWEALCSFIISQNNNIPRIKKLVSALCYACNENETVPYGMEEHIADIHKELKGSFSPFPTPGRVEKLGIEGLSELKMGFRAKYIYDAAQKVNSGEIDLLKISKLDTQSASQELQKIKGVGVKVAACTLLYGNAHLDAFPIDVWIKRVIEKYFDENFSPSDLGKYAGVAQQYLFYYERYIQSKREGDKI